MSAKKDNVIFKRSTVGARSSLTVSDVDYIISKERLDDLQEPREIEAIYLANNLQKGFIYHALNQGDIDDAYHVQLFWQYHRPINENNLKQAWAYAQNKFCSLRLRFDWQEDLVQIIDKEGTLDWRYTDLTDELNTEKQETTIRNIQEKDRLERYDLAQGNLFRIYLLKQKSDLHSCIFSNHHSIIDSWSMPILLEFVHDTYLKLEREEPIFLQLGHAYKAAQHYIQKHREDNKDYWKKYVGQVEGRSDLSGLLSSSDTRLSEYKQILCPTEKTLAISGNLYSSLKLLSRQEGVTLNAILQYVWHKVLHVYGNNKQTIVGTTLPGRSLPVEDIEKSVGLYINTLPLIVDHQENKLIIDSIKGIQSSIDEFNERSNVNLANLQPSAERLFDSLFVYENHPNPTCVMQDEVSLVFNGSVEKLDYPLCVIAYEVNNQLIFKLQFAREIFKEDTINDLLNLIKILLEQLPSHAYRAVNNLSYLNAQQYNQIVHRWNATEKEYPADKTIHQIFEEQVAKTPDSVAIIYERVQLTYKELNIRANQLAKYLIEEYSIKPDSLIPLCLDRGEHMLIAIFAVLKSGGAYVPIDPNYPDERIQYILQDTSANLILINEKHQERVKNNCCIGNTNQKCLETRELPNILSIDNQEFMDKLSSLDGTNPSTTTTSANLAYIMYTSGTTGKPKGVMVEHRGLVNLNYALVDRYALGSDIDIEVILQFSNYVFDLSAEQFILGLLNGHVVLLLPNYLFSDKERFLDYLFVNKVTHVNATPRFLEQYNFSKILSLKRLISAGDCLSKQIYNKLCVNNSIKIINGYGPTETSVISTAQIIREDNLNIGSPIYNTKCYVLAQNLAQVPAGAIGELHIGGAGVARGYLNRPDLTAEKFIPNPFQTEEENKLGKYARLYKTGDLVRWLPDGNLQYIGRNDFQVQIRAYRIELGEIESALLGYKGVQQSVALAKEHSNVTSESSGDKYLVGYYVSDNKLDEENILQYLRSKLPVFMIPAILVHLNDLPLNINGKLDRKALPDPEFKHRDNYVAPRNEIEKKVCQIWAEVLGLNSDKVGTHDDFFRLGGDSITGILLVSRLRKELQLNVSIKDIFTCKNIAKLYDNVLVKEFSVHTVSSLKTVEGI